MRYPFNLFSPIFLVFCLAFAACSKDEEEVRMPQNILGVWSPSENSYLEFCDNNEVHNLLIEYQDGISIGDWTRDAYYYEPGYNLVIYLTSNHDALVYQIVELADSRLIWCPVDKIDTSGGSESIGEIIGSIINKAQEGFNLDPELYMYFQKISYQEFYNLLDNLGIEYPWVY